MTTKKCRFTANVAITLVGNLGKMKQEEGIATQLLDKVRTTFWLDFLKTVDELGLLFRTTHSSGLRGVVDTIREVSQSEADAAVSELVSWAKLQFAVENMTTTKPCLGPRFK